MDAIGIAITLLVAVNVWAGIGIIVFWLVLTDAEQKIVDDCTILSDVVLWPVVLLMMGIKRVTATAREQSDKK